MTTCSAASALLGEPLAGTAPVARSWLVVESPAPWGRDAITDGGLPEPVRAALGAAKAAGVGVLLARHPDRLARSGATDRHVWVARSAAGGTLLRHAVLDRLDQVADWDMAALATGSLPAVGSLTREPLLLVCTHAKRDQCCAVNGRALVGALLEALPDRLGVWECSHVGGHRFAPVTVSLPTGTVHGRLSVTEAARLATAHLSAEVLVDHLRGRTAFPAPLQAAEVSVRRAADVAGADDLDVLVVRDGRAVPVALGWAVPLDGVEVEVRHVDGRAWRADVRATHWPGERPESCGADPVPVHTWAVRQVRPAPRWA